MVVNTHVLRKIIGIAVVPFMDITKKNEFGIFLKYYSFGMGKCLVQDMSY